jgi:hypothetical protein
MREQKSNSPPLDLETQERMKRFSEPSECHKLFENVAGAWNLKGLYALDVGMEEVESAGEASIKLIMGGRYMEVDLWHYAPSINFRYEAHSLHAYDRFSEKYKANWINNVNTNFHYLSGHWYGDADKLVLRGGFTHPFQGRKVPMDMTMIIPGGFGGKVDEFAWELLSPNSSGEMACVVRLDLTRKQ